MKKTLSKILIFSTMLSNINMLTYAQVEPKFLYSNENYIFEDEDLAISSPSQAELDNEKKLNATKSNAEHEHEYIRSTYFEAKCFDYVTNYEKCKWCEDERILEVLDPAGHDLHVQGIYAGIDEKDCSDESSMGVAYCKRCGYISQAQVEAVNSHGLDSIYLSTRKECGYDYDLYRCNTCNKEGEVRRWTGENTCEFTKRETYNATCVSKGYEFYACKLNGYLCPNSYYKMEDYLDHSYVNDGFCSICGFTKEENSEEYTYTLEFWDTSFEKKGNKPLKIVTLKRDEEFTVPNSLVDGIICTYFFPTTPNSRENRFIPGETYKNIAETDGAIIKLFTGNEYAIRPMLKTNLTQWDDNFDKIKYRTLLSNEINRSEPFSDKMVLDMVFNSRKDDLDYQDLIRDKDPGLLHLEETIDSTINYTPFNSPYHLSDSLLSFQVILFDVGQHHIPNEFILRDKYEQSVFYIQRPEFTEKDEPALFEWTYLNNQKYSLCKYKVDKIVKDIQPEFRKYKLKDTIKGTSGNQRSICDDIDSFCSDSFVLEYEYTPGVIILETNNGYFINDSENTEWSSGELPTGQIAEEALNSVNSKIGEVKRKGYTFDGLMMETDIYDRGCVWYNEKWYKPMNQDTLWNDFIISGTTYIAPNWKPNKINLTIDWNHDDVTENSLHWILDYGSHVPKFEGVSLEGYKIAGYFANPDGTGEQLGTRVLFEDTIFYAHWVLEDIDVPEPPIDPEDPQPPVPPTPEEPEEPEVKPEEPGKPEEPEEPEVKPEEPIKPNKPSKPSGGSSPNQPGSGGNDINNGPGVEKPKEPIISTPIESAVPENPTLKPPVNTDSSEKEIARELTKEELSWYIENNKIPLGYKLNENGDLIWIGNNPTPLGLPKTGDVGESNIVIFLFSLLSLITLMKKNYKLKK